MNMQRRRQFCFRVYRVGGAPNMVVPVSMCRSAPVPVHMSMPNGDGDAPSGRVKRVIFPFMRMPVIMARMCVTVVVLMWGAKPKLTPRAYCNPEAKCHERDTGKPVNGIAETLGSACAHEPDCDTKQERRCDVSRAGLNGHLRGFGSRPSSLPGQKRDRSPMIGNDRVKYANPNNGGDQQKLLRVEHSSSALKTLQPLQDGKRVFFAITTPVFDGVPAWSDFVEAEVYSASEGRTSRT